MKKRVLVLVLVLVSVVALVPTALAITSMTDPSTVNKTPYTKDGGNTYSAGQCTWYAWGRYKELCGASLPTGKDAKDWLQSAQNAGYETGSTPKVGAIACWTADVWDNTNQLNGHVAVVEDIDGNTIRISQYNRGVRYGGGLKFGGMNGNTWQANFLEPISTTRTSWSGNNPPKPSGYIYLKTSSTPAKTTITFSSLTVPGTLTEGTDAMLDGSFTSTNSKICSVKAEIINSASGAVSLSASSSGNFSVWTYGPLTNSKLNTDLNLGALKPGTYYVRYTVTTQDGTTATKSTSTFTVKCSTHTWGSWTTTKAASCGAAGSRTHTCTKCGATTSETIAALAHNYQKTSMPTYNIFTCSNCKNSYRVDTVSWIETVNSVTNTWSVGIRNSSEKELQCVFLVACYEDGRLVSLRQRALHIPSSSSQIVNTNIPLETGAMTWKVFVLGDETLSPLLSALEY